MFVVDRLVGGLSFQVGRYEHGQHEAENQQSDDHHVGRQIAHGAEHPAVDGRQYEADQLRAAVQESAGRALRDRIRQLDGQLVADRQVSGHEQPVRYDNMCTGRNDHVLIIIIIIGRGVSVARGLITCGQTHPSNEAVM